MKKLILTLALCCTLGGVLQVQAQNKSQTQRPKITAVAHGGFFTKDFVETRDLFKDYFGFEEPVLMPNIEEGGYRFAFIKVNESQYVEIFPERSTTANRMYHFAVLTEDAEAMRIYLKSKGCEVPDTTPKGRTRNSNYFVTDPNGTICEVVEYEPDSMTAETKGQFLPEDRISSKLSHVGFACPDLDKALSFYVGIMGFKEVWRGGPSADKVEIVHLQVPEGKECIELILTNGKQPSWKEECSMHHLCFEVDDIEATKKTLDSRKMPAGCSGSTKFITGYDGKRFMNFYNVDGTRIQIVEK